MFSLIEEGVDVAEEEEEFPHAAIALHNATSKRNRCRERFMKASCEDEQAIRHELMLHPDKSLNIHTLSIEGNGSVCQG